MNLVVLVFVNPLKLLDQTTDSGDVNGVPAGMTSTVVNQADRSGTGWLAARAAGQSRAAMNTRIH